ncbi:GDSL-type esterase/lipase family protein [Aeoliella mucimassa]|nr:GDSL-type esterase/lipase family protein [Aeoliella mucimassa]
MATAAEFSVLPLGDSITAGNGFGGYRAQLGTDLTSQGHTFHLLGSQVMQDGGETSAALRAPYDGLHHEGHGGWRIDQLDANLNGNTNADASTNGGYYITGGNGTGRDPIYPNYALVLAGINDVNQYFGQKSDAGQQMDADELLPILQGRVTSLVDNLSTLRPDTRIMLSNVIPYANGLLNDQVTGATTAQRQIWAAEDGVSAEQEHGVNHYVILYNKWLANEFVPAQQAAGVNIELVDQYQNFLMPDGSVRGWGPDEPNGYADYGLHPNQFGYDLMGATWAAAINQHLIAQTVCEATINRADGSITLTNTSDAPIAIQSLSLISTAGAISVADLTPITGNYDSNGNQQVDDQPWVITEQSATNFREASTGDAGSIAVGGSVQLSLAGGWTATPYEELQVNIQLGDGSSAYTNVVYTGTPIVVGDLDGNGTIDRTDYNLLTASGETDLSALLKVQAYRQGDLNGDGSNDYEDFRLFKNAYIAEHGDAAFAAMVAVPEPTAMPLALGMALLLFGAIVKRQASTSRLICRVS